MDKNFEFRSYPVRYIIDGFRIKALSNKIGTPIVVCNVSNDKCKLVSEVLDLVRWQGAPSGEPV
jgi:hypothetical protein